MKKGIIFNGIIFASVAIVALVWVVSPIHVSVSLPVEEYCAPLANPKPIQSAYRTFWKLTVNTFDRDTVNDVRIDDEVLPIGKDVYNIELEEGKEDYAFIHNGKRVDFKFRREMQSGVCLEYILYKGKRISVKVNEVW